MRISRVKWDIEVYNMNPICGVKRDEFLQLETIHYAKRSKNNKK